jgi:mRNA-degrading endonuclease YafQ of YafQ-DinJ toxin-antitoxin module
MIVKFSSKFENKLIKLGKRNKDVFRKLSKQIELLKDDVSYPSLRLHKLDSVVEDLWSLSLDRKLRTIFIWNVEIDEVYFVDIGNHDEVYRK